jgi:hypothetical protein
VIDRARRVRHHRASVSNASTPDARVRALIPCAAMLALLARAQPAAAFDRPVDGVYGRLTGDVVFSVEAGGGVALVNGAARGGFSAALRFRYLDMAGAFVRTDFAFGGARTDAISVGVDLRPLLFARVFSDWEHGPRWLDLMVDSIGLDMGVSWIDAGAPWRNGSGLAFLLGGGIEFPLVWAQGNALMLRFSAHWIHATDIDAQGATPGEQVYFTLGLTGRAIARLGVIGIH